MEQVSPPPDAGTPPALMTLEGQLREMYGRVAYTNKAHEKIADRHERKYRSVKAAEIWLSAIASGSFLAAIAIFVDPAWTKYATVLGQVLTAVLFGLSLYFKEANFIARAQLHTDVASKLWGVREALLSLLVDLASGRDVENIRRERNTLNDKLTEIYQGAPRTDAKAYSEAQHALKDSEELFFTDAELDKMLPKQLRRSDIPERVTGDRV